MRPDESVAAPEAREERPVPTDPGSRRTFWRRRRYIVDVRFQGWLIAAFATQMLVFAAVLAIAMFLPAILAVRSADGRPAAVLDAARQLLALDDRFWPAVGAAFLLTLLLALRTSHKIAGPLYRFRRVFEALIRREDPGTWKLRKGDCLMREAEFVDQVGKSVVEDRERLAALEEELRVCREQLAARASVDGETVAERPRRQARRTIPGDES